MSVVCILYKYRKGQVLDTCSAELALHKGTDVYSVHQNKEFCLAYLAIFWSAPEDGDLVAVLQLGQHRPQLLVLLLRNVHRQVHYGLVDALGS